MKMRIFLAALALIFTVSIASAQSNKTTDGKKECKKECVEKKGCCKDAKKDGECTKKEKCTKTGECSKKKECCKDGKKCEKSKSECCKDSKKK